MGKKPGNNKCLKLDQGRGLKTYWEPGIKYSAIIHWFIYIMKYMSEEVLGLLLFQRRTCQIEANAAIPGDTVVSTAMENSGSHQSELHVWETQSVVVTY